MSQRKSGRQAGPARSGKVYRQAYHPSLRPRSTRSGSNGAIPRGPDLFSTSISSTASRQGGPRPEAAPGDPGLVRSSFDFNRISIFPSPEPVTVNTAPPKLPKAPTPKKGEKPVGQMAIEGESAKQDIYRSFIQQGIWWFNGETPTLGEAFFPTEASIPLSSLGKGHFKVSVVKGDKFLGAKAGGNVISGKDLSSADFKSKGASLAPKDVTIEVEHTAPGTKKTEVYSTQLEVRAPHHLSYLGADHQASGSQGFKTVHYSVLYDNFNQPMPYMDVNEDFDRATLEKGVTSEWKTGFAARAKGSTITRSDAHFTDDYAATLSGTAPKSMNPQPANPKTPLGSTRVGEFKHRWFAGSKTTGKGVQVSDHVGVFYSDHGAYTKFKSPP